jgi:oxygen-independent coproporphyrinogen III oxidase
MCRFETNWMDEVMQMESLYHALELLHEAADDGLIELAPYQLRVTEKGRAFTRNICMAFDARLQNNKPNQKIFSTTI